LQVYISRQREEEKRGQTAFGSILEDVPWGYDTRNRCHKEGWGEKFELINTMEVLLRDDAQAKVGAGTCMDTCHKQAVEHKALPFTIS